MPQTTIHPWSFVSLALALFISNSAMAADTFVIVSDVDDTVKVTDVLHPARAIGSKLVFAGMPELYAQLLGPGSSRERLRFISGSSQISGHLTEALLAFPAYNLTLRGLRPSDSSARYYESERMKSLYGTSHKTFILIGDDTKFDPEVYTNFAAAMPDQVRAIYIRRITGRPLPTGCIPFVTAYDIALEERLAGHISEAQAAAVGRAVLASPDNTLLPRFQKCPIAGAREQNDLLENRIQKRIGALCAPGTLPQPASP